MRAEGVKRSFQPAFDIRLHQSASSPVKKYASSKPPTAVHDIAAARA